MKKLPVLICLPAILLTLATVASGSQPEEKSFAITGYTTSYDVERLPSGRAKFHLTAEGEPGALCQQYFGDEDLCGVSGYFEGTFTFDEWGIVDLDPITLQGSGWGTNHGTMTIVGDDDSKVVIRFGGRTDSKTVWGNFTVLRGSGVCEDLHGQGKYAGNAGLMFTVEFTGRFHTDPQ